MNSSEELKEIGILTMKFGLLRIHEAVVRMGFSRSRVKLPDPETELEMGIQDLKEGRVLIDRSAKKNF